MYERPRIPARVLPLGTRQHIKRLQALKQNKRVALRIGSEGSSHSSIVEFALAKPLPIYSSTQDGARLQHAFQTNLVSTSMQSKGILTERQ